MKKALVVGGGNGIGLTIVHALIERNYEKVFVIDRNCNSVSELKNVFFEQFNLIDMDYSIFDKYSDIDTLIITAGFGRLSFFENIHEHEIINSMRVNAEAVMRIVKKFYNKIAAKDDFYCGIMGSICGLINSPLFATYSASKAAIYKFIEALNTELIYCGYDNRILNASPGNIKGTCFDGSKETKLDLVREFANSFLDSMFKRETLLIPHYEDVYLDIIKRNNENPYKFGLESIEYKKQSGRIDVHTEPQLKIGYLSGTFDLFHIGHLNLLKRAKQYCDYLVVGVHKDAYHKGKQTFISFEERMKIVESIRYVDKVIESCKEDVDVYKKDIIKYNILFVGSDYKGSERFNNYEAYFADKDVEIVYFPYTQGTSSTELRNALSK